MEDITGLTFTMDGETYVLHNSAAGEAETGETAEDGAASADAEKDTGDGTTSTEAGKDAEDGAASAEAENGTGDGTASAEGWFYQGTEIDVTDLETALGALSADSFTEEPPTGKEEIRFTAYLSNANFPKVEVVNAIALK